MFEDAAHTRVVIVGAGIAGLVCAVALQRAGYEVTVVEREPEIGGRVRSRRVDGYTIDRGFQVLFTAYPTLARHVTLDALAPRRFVPGARIATGAAAPYFGDPTRALAFGVPGMIADMAAGRALSLRDTLRVAALRRLATSLSIDDCFAPRRDALPAREFLRARGLSSRAIERFFAPFYGGILLDPGLDASASVLLFTLKMLSEGETVVPAAGMGALPREIAARLRAGTVRTSATVAHLTRDDARVTGVTLVGGERIAAAHVVLAAEPPAIARLALDVGVRVSMPVGALGCATVWLAARTPVLSGRAIWLNAMGASATASATASTVLHAVTMTDVAPEYASPDALGGPHLVAATAVGASADTSDDALVAGAIADVTRMSAPLRGNAPAPALTPIAVERVPYSQYPQPPGSHAHPTPAASTLAGLWIASEAAHSSSLEGAARGGTAAAAAILASRGARVGV